MRKSRFNESQRKALVDAYLKGNKTVEQLCEEQQISPAVLPPLSRYHSKVEILVLGFEGMRG